MNLFYLRIEAGLFLQGETHFVVGLVGDEVGRRRNFPQTEKITLSWYFFYKTKQKANQTLPSLSQRLRFGLDITRRA
jgi:hypothetical protein